MLEEVEAGARIRLMDEHLLSERDDDAQVLEQLAGGGGEARGMWVVKWVEQRAGRAGEARGM